MRHHSRHLMIIATMAATAIGLSGCVIIKSNSSAQLAGIGQVQITTTFCASDNGANNPGYDPPDSSCQGPGHGGNSGNDASNVSSGGLQLLIAYRIPSNVTASDTITTTIPGGGSALSFSQSPTYTSELQGKAAAPAGEKWVGYLSDPTSYSVAGNQYFTVAPRFELDQGADGSPFEGPFNYRVIVGMRFDDGSHPASRPVDCGAGITTFFDDGSGAMVCADSPSSAAIANDLQQATQDLGILDAPGPQSVIQGHIARVNFETAYAGDGNQSPTFDLSASTDVPGADATPSAPVLTPEDGTTPLRVLMRVPVNTDPGTYHVTLTASLASGETRSSTHEIMVTRTKVRCNAAAPTIAGTRGDDILIGTAGPDVIASYAGDDEVLGLRGNDLICTGRGDDTIRGGRGNDRIAGRRGNDRLIGGSGRNVIAPGPGKDRIIQ